MKTITKPLLAVSFLLQCLACAETPVLAWKKNYGHPQNGFDSGLLVAVGRNGEVATAGVSMTNYVASGTTFITNTDLRVANYKAPTGNLRWEKFYDSEFFATETPQALVVDLAGNVVVASTAYRAASASGAIYIGKYGKAGGALQWARTYDIDAEHGYDEPRDMAIDKDNNVIVVGSAARFTGITDALALKYSPLGDLLWERRTNAAQSSETILDSRYNAVAVDKFQAIAAVGEGYDNVNNLFRPYIIRRHGLDGGVLMDTYLGSSSVGGQLFDVINEPKDGNVFVCGEVFPAGGNTNLTDGYIAKLNPASGDVFWEKTLAGPNNGEDYLKFIALDREGNVFVAGTYSDGAAPDFFVAKLSGKNGRVLWRRQIPGKNGQDDYLLGLALDPTGNPVVTGNMRISPAGFAVRTMKLANASGATLWDARRNPGRTTSQCRDLAVDKSGNVYVSGITYFTDRNVFGNSQTKAFLLKYVMQP